MVLIVGSGNVRRNRDALLLLPFGVALLQAQMLSVFVLFLFILGSAWSF